MPRAVFESPSARTRGARAAAWLADRPDAAITIVGATIESAAEIARRAFDQGGGERRASLGWHRTTLGALASTLARTELARCGLVPAGPLALEAICARVVHEHSGTLGRFEPIREQPGLPRALARTLSELRLACVHEPADPDLARLLEAYANALDAAQLADRARTLAIATEVAREIATGRPPDEAGSLLFVDAPVRSRAERELVAALVERAKDALAVVPSGDGRTLESFRTALGAQVETHVPFADEGPLAHLHAELFGTSASVPPAAVEGAIDVLSAPGESRECVEIARIVMKEAARGTPLDRMAVLLRAPSYGPHVAEAFRRARLPVFFARGTRRPDPAGRAFLALLACAAEDLSARRFAEYLSIGQVPDDGEDGAPPPPLPRAERVAAPDDETLRALIGEAAADAHLDEAARAKDDEPGTEAPSSLAEEDLGGPAYGTLRTPRHWERILVEAAVIGKADRWQRRLAGHTAKLRDDVAAYEAKDETALAEGSRRELHAVLTLQRFALPLIDDLAALPAEATWGEWVDKLGALATRALARSDRVLEVLAELAPMAKVAQVSIGEVRLVLAPRLSQLLVPSAGRRYGKVFVATMDEARGLSFDVVFVPGLAEKIFPQKVSEDPLLLDEARRRLSPDLPTNKDRTDEERLALRLALGAASRRVVLSYPRVDVEQARPRTPSFYGLEVLRVAEGQLHDFEHLATRAALGAEARIGWPAPARREDAIDEAEYDLALLKDVLDKPEGMANGEGNYLIEANPHLGRALRFRWARWDAKQLRSSDGLVNPSVEGLAAIHEHATDKRSFSPTALQHFAACPYRFLLSAVHKLAPREEPAALEDVDPLTRGSLVHEVQYRLLTLLHHEGALPVTPASLEKTRARLDGVLAEVAREYQDRLSPAIDRVWQDAITGIGADLREWLQRMTQEPEWVPAHFELSFGLKDPRAQDEKSTDEPVALDIGLRLRGSIDLVEKKRTGALRAVDFKTGKVKAKKDAVIGGGEILQPVLYALALERLFPGTKVEEGVLYYCTSAGGFEKVPVPLNDAARSAAHAVAKTVGDALTKGFLPAAPVIEKKGYSACTWCDYSPVCGPYEEIRTKRKPQAPLKVLDLLRKHR